MVAIIVSAGAAISLLWFFLLLPMNRHRHQLEDDIVTMSSELAQKNYFFGEAALERRLAEESSNYETLRQEWRKTAAALQAYTPKEDMETSTVAHIDFKVALFDVRQRLLKKSKTLGVSLPRDIGVDEAVESNDDAYQRMLQLRVVEKMLDLALDLKIKTVREIRPLPPVRHRSGPAREEFFTEYPLELDLFGSMDNLYELMAAVLEPGHVFVLRGLRLEPVTATKTDLFTIKAVMSAMLFAKSPGEIAVAPQPQGGPRRAAPLGH